MPLTAQRKAEIVTQYQRGPADTGSPEVQISMLTAEIVAIAEHLKGHQKDNHSRRGLLLKVGRRNKLLRYLARTNPADYQKLIAKLGLRK